MINFFFNTSRILYPDELNKPKASYLQYVEFIEFLGRLADFLSYPRVYHKYMKLATYELRN